MPDRAAAAVLEMMGVSKTYKSGGAVVRVLDRVELSVDAGEVVVVVGESGSGKSSLLRVAGLLSAADEGEVRIKGAPVGFKSPNVRGRKVGFVFQHGNLLGDLTVIDNLAVAVMGRDVPDLRGMLSAVGMEESSGRRAKYLSGGEAQRVAFVRAMVNQPCLLLIDEPTANLDSDNGARLCRMIAAAAEGGAGCLVASHDPGMLGIASRVYRMEGGRVA